MDKVVYEMHVPKEGKELVDAVHGLVSHFVNGGDVAGATAQLPAVMSAVEGINKLGDELKSDGKDELAAYLVHRLWEALEKDAPAE